MLRSRGATILALCWVVSTSAFTAPRSLANLGTLRGFGAREARSLRLSPSAPQPLSPLRDRTSSSAGLSMQLKPEDGKIGSLFDFKSKVVGAEDAMPAPPMPISDGSGVAAVNGEGLGLWEARGMVMLAAALCGTNFGALKILQKSLDPATLLSARFMLASAVMAPMMMKGRKEAMWAGFESGLWLAGGYIVQAMALQTIPAATTAFLGSLTTVVCPFIEKYTGAKVGNKAWAAAALAVLGAAFLECAGGTTPGLGDGWALLVPVSFGVFFHKTHSCMKDHPDQALPITGMQMVAVASSGVVWSVLQAHGIPAQDINKLWELMHDVNFDLALAWIAIAATAFALALETVAMAKLPSSETAVIYSSEPLWATGFAAVLLGEEIGKNTIIGGSHIVAACLGSVADFGSLRKDFFKLRKLSRKKAKKEVKRTKSSLSQKN